MAIVYHTMTLDRGESKSKMKSNGIRRQERQEKKGKTKEVEWVSLAGKTAGIETPADFGALRQ